MSNVLPIARGINYRLTLLAWGMADYDFELESEEYWKWVDEALWSGDITHHTRRIFQVYDDHPDIPDEEMIRIIESPTRWRGIERQRQDDQQWVNAPLRWEEDQSSSSVSAAANAS